ncbi:NAD(P)-dependent oxidoreductase [Reyranella sp.]|jgi:D-3-phosphoglycerate dehydrogenase|uniref:NAD(P)-dependent oxidoreductase n=1 Tax=Reyranella sp. TaxID=1929291 RepID=UPI000BCD1DE3|nr:NAD(P)-dependent oxidoreductase [Reyranella sp.]OYY46797.1 MAG: hydroxyacid dehydrogenase [Rhodospirillales bacterium 35-66-84]OYZ96817.1 MAG: hydroxyacid dehydrogenase [Rhodospirillales bacterium 24-66-33]OZB27854.1 MAG: hydroxyacid dehydrogenase [Rhodospirillales bacterium 39-66-50]HQS13707.1 NAD(P)-dependent oxidoreductase [Reyranella sp.]HQT10192.1 NAD(P)-dependent oxidoreductase [Reyranella sp.]
MKKLLLTHAPLARRQYYGTRALTRLQELVEVVLHEGEAPLDPQGVIGRAHGVDFIVADRATAIPALVFESLPGLHAVMRSAIDIRNIDVAAATKAGVLVTQADAGFVASVVELTLGFLVDLSRGITRAATAYHEGAKPEIRVGRQLGGSTAGLIGYGRISRALAPVLAQLGMTVLVSDPYAQVDDPRYVKLPMEDLLAKADYVICLAIANEETENLFDAAAFARMKPDAFFINMSRGNLVDEGALAEVLRENRIAGAAMDVGRAPDQMPSPELARLPNVIATPHIGGLTPPASESQAMDTVRQVEALVKGEAPPGAVNLVSWTRRG